MLIVMFFCGDCLLPQESPTVLSCESGPAAGCTKRPNFQKSDPGRQSFPGKQFKRPDMSDSDTATCCVGGGEGLSFGRTERFKGLSE